MKLETERHTPDYLYGRLLAIADNIENYALRMAGEGRETTAARLMQRFADRPFSTWRTIEFVVGQAVQVGGLLVRHDHQMPAVVGIFIEQRETCAVARDDMVGLVVRGLRDTCEQAGVQLRLWRQDVFDPPRCMQ